MRNLLLVMLAELKTIFSSKGLVSVLILGPIVYFILYPQPYLNEVLRDIPVVVIDQDNSHQSRELIRTIDRTEAVDVKYSANSMEEAEKLLKSRHAYGIIMIPHAFEKNIAAGKKSAISFYGDASYILIYSNISTAINAAVLANNRNISIDRQIAQGVDSAIAKGNSSPFTPNLVALFNSQSGYATYLLPAVFILIPHQLLLIGMLIASVLGRNNMGALVNTLYPKRSRFSTTLTIILGKLMTYVMLYSIVFVFYAIFIQYSYHLPNLANPFLYFVFGLLFLVSTSLFALAVSGIVKKIDDIFLLIVPLSMIIFFITGVSWPKDLIPDFIIWFSHLVPAVPAMLESIKLTQMGTPFSFLSCEMINLFILSLVYFVVSIWVYWRRLKKMDITPID